MDQVYKLKFAEIKLKRSQRKQAALDNFMSLTYAVPPKPVLESLTKTRNMILSKLENDPNNSNLLAALQNVNLKINNEDYAKPDSEDMAYLNSYHTHAQSFVWPSAEELALQNVEDEELKNLGANN